MRVRISTKAPLAPVKAWFPVHPEVTPTVSSFKSVLSTSLPAFRGHALHLSVDGFDLLDDSDISVLKDGDLICVDATRRDQPEKTVAQTVLKRQEPEGSRKRKRYVSLSSSSSSTSEPELSSSSSSSVSGSESDSEDSSRPTTPSLRKIEPLRAHISAAPHIQPKPYVARPTTFVPPGYGKPQTRSRNLRRRLKRTHEREAAEVTMSQPISGANVVVAVENGSKAAVDEASQDAQTGLLSLSLRNKNKAKNFKSLMSRPLAPKIVFGDQEDDACGVAASERSGTSKTQVGSRLIPPSSRQSLPPNVFVTSVDVEAYRRERRKSKMRVEYGDELEGEGEEEVVDANAETDIDKLESIADKQWATLARLTRDATKPGMVVGHRGLGINPETYTPEELVTLASVVSCEDGLVVRWLRRMSFSGPVDGPGEAERYPWEEIDSDCWRIIT